MVNILPSSERGCRFNLWSGSYDPIGLMAKKNQNINNRSNIEENPIVLKIKKMLYTTGEKLLETNLMNNYKAFGKQNKTKSYLGRLVIFK